MHKLSLMLIEFPPKDIWYCGLGFDIHHIRHRHNDFRSKLNKHFIFNGAESIIIRS